LAIFDFYTARWPDFIVYLRTTSDDDDDEIAWRLPVKRLWYVNSQQGQLSLAIPL